MKTISSRSNPLVKSYRDAAAGRVGSLLLDGSHLVDEAVRAGLRITSAAFSSRGLAEPGTQALLDRLQAAGAPVYSVSDDVLKAMSPVRSPSGMAALADRPAWSLSQVFDAPRTDNRAKGDASQLVIIAVGVQDPGNVGAIVRAAEAGGATGAVFSGPTADPFGWKALRGSMGSALRFPIVMAETEEAFTVARASGVKLIATVPRHGRPMSDVDMRGPIAFVLGGEGPGLPQDLADAADDRVSIPMRPAVESLNVAVAAALLIYEAARQRARA